MDMLIESVQRQFMKRLKPFGPDAEYTYLWWGHLIQDRVVELCFHSVWTRDVTIPMPRVAVTQALTVVVDQEYTNVYV